jgi:hypothetical protein
METFIQQITQTTGSYIPRILAALAVFIIGWIIAQIISSVTLKLLRRTTVDNRIYSWISAEGAEGKEKPVEIEKSISRGLFYLIMLFVLVAAFQALGITLITEPINNLLNGIFRYAPQLLGALLLVIVAWVVAKLMKLLVEKGLSATGFDEKLGPTAGVTEERMPLTKTLSQVVFWLVLLVFFPAILSTLGLEGLLGPVQTMLNKILVFLPNLFTAALIGLVGWLIARFIQKVVTNLLEAVGADRLSEKVHLAPVLGKQKLSGVLGLIVYILVLIPILVAALQTLKLEAVTQPASRMLEMILAALPNIFAAALILVISYIIGRIVAGLVSNLLEGLGFNRILPRLGIGKEISEGTWTPSSVIGYLVLLGIMLFALIEAAERLEFGMVAGIFSQFAVLAGHIILGLIIFAIGLFLANVFYNAILATSASQSRFLAASARIAIIILAGAMALRQMGLANEIINLAFGLILGAIAIAVAVAFGMGGREIAGRELNEWINSMKSRNDKNQ